MKVISHVDMDAFYTQVEITRDPDRLAGQPVVVIQYNPFGDLSTLQPDDDRIKPESNGSIIAVSYEARKYGVKRNMMAQQAKKLCPILQIVQVPVAHGKADLTIYRDAGAAVIKVLSKSGVCERASIDEAYLDVTAAAQELLAEARKGGNKNSSTGSGLNAAGAGMGQLGAGASDQTAAEEASEMQADEQLEQLGGAEGGLLHMLPLPETFEGWHVAGVEPEGPEAVRDWWSRHPSSWTQSDALVAAGAVVVARARAAVKEALGFTCSAGIAHSKILAKLGSGLHKPAQQTVVPAAAVPGLLAPLPVSKLRQLGGKFGEEVMAKLNVATVGDLAAVPLLRLEAALGVQDAAWLHRLAQGQDGEEVKPRTLPKSISCGKTFRGNNVLTGLTAVHSWLLQLGQELQERIEADRQQHQRLPKLLTVAFDSAPVDAQTAATSDPAAAGAAATAGAGSSASAAAAAAGVDGAMRGGSTAAGPSHGRLNAQNWRAGATAISRSCTLRHPRADAIATDALGLVKKWARGRPNGFRIVTMFISASNFSIAPTGASTLDRFFTAPPAAATDAPATATAARASSGAFDNIQQQPQQDRGEQLLGGAQRSTSSSGLAPKGGPKRPAAAGTGPLGRQSKTARTGSTQQGDLRAFFAAAATAPAAATQPAQAAAAATATAIPAGSGSAGTSLLGAVHYVEADVQQQSMGSEVLSSSQDLTDVDSEAVCSPHTCPVAAGASCPAVPTDGQATLSGNPEPGTAAVAGASPQHSAPTSHTLLESAVVIAAAQHSHSRSAAEVNLSSGGVGFLSVGPAAHSSGPATAALTAASLPVTQQEGVQHQQQQQQEQQQLEVSAHQQPEQQPHACHHQQQPQEQQQLCSQRRQHPVSSSGSGWAPQQLALADLDPEVMAALPWDIQMEVQQQLRSNRLSTSSHGRASSRQGSTRGGRSSGAGARGRQAGPSIARFLKSSKK